MAEEVRVTATLVKVHQGEARGGSRKHSDGCRCGKCPKVGRPRGSRNRTKAELEDEVQKKRREKAEILQLRQQLRQGVHRLNWKMHAEPATELQSGEPVPSAFIPPWRLPKIPAVLSRTELLDVLAQARANRERDWLMILVAAWHGLSPVEVTGFTKDSVLGGCLTIKRLKSHKRTVQPLVRHENPLLDEREALLNFVENVPLDQPVFNISRKTFYRLVHKYALAAGIPPNKANPRALKHSVATHSLIPGDVPPKSTHTLKGPGRPKEPEEEKSYFGWGQKVEDKIPAGLKQDTTTIVNARRLVAGNSRMPYDTIVLYHQRFRKTLKQRGESALVS